MNIHTINKFENDFTKEDIDRILSEISQYTNDNAWLKEIACDLNQTDLYILYLRPVFLNNKTNYAEYNYFYNKYYPWTNKFGKTLKELKNGEHV